MKALLVIDVQNGIIELGDFTNELFRMEHIIKDFKASGNPVIFMRHIDASEESPLCRSSVGSELHPSLKDYADVVIEKSTPSSFYQTNLSQTLDQLGVMQLFLVGFETEFCCMFTAIAAFDRGYEVTLIRDAVGTTNTERSYDMPGLSINDFVSKVLGWSSVIEVINHVKYMESYKAHGL
ncbi:isochorismatase family protein [Paenibacillus sp. 2TAB19]|uniref:isochorismatase family protein n=1 Tax=Paenibacillus sp. 2TAB19 TaxID=3233003 RepID=UPI003F956641